MGLASLQDTDIDDAPRNTSSGDDDLATIGCGREALASEDELLNHDIFEDFCFLHTYREKDMDYYGSIFVLFEGNLDLFSKNDRTRSEKSIIECEPSSKDLSYIDPRGDQDTNIRSSITNSLYPIISCDVEGTLDMKWLRDDRDATCEGEYLLGPDHRIERPESGIVE